MLEFVNSDKKEKTEAVLTLKTCCAHNTLTLRKQLVFVDSHCAHANYTDTG